MSGFRRTIEGRETVVRLVDGSKKSIFSIIFGRSAIIVVLLLLQVVLLYSLSHFLAKYIPYLYGSILLFTLFMLVYLLNTRHNPMVKLTWCITVAIIPAFGALLYLLTQLDLGHRAEQKLLQATERESAKYVPDCGELAKELRDTQPALANLSNYTLERVGCPAFRNGGVRYFKNGNEKFEELLRQLKSAEKFIFLEYFIVEEGYMWGSILNLLLEKARQGVEVRLMYDGTCSFGRLPRSYPKRLEELGIRCKVFAPIRPLVSTSYNNRDHRKIVVIDGKVAFTGGVNLSDEYIGRRIVHGEWKDAAIMVSGEAVRSFTLMFLRMWNSTERVRDYEAYLEPPKSAESEAGYVLPYSTSPLDGELVGEMVYLDIINRACRYVYIMTPYLILDNEMLTALKFAARRGVDVRIILPHIPDKKYAFLLAKTHYRELLGAGVRIYEFTPGFVHSKVFLSDDARAVVGTINLDYRSLYLHFECAVYLEGVSEMESIAADFEETFPRCIEVGPAYLKREKLRDRVAGALLKVVAPLM